jgi:hypothetical protein
VAQTQLHQIIALEKGIKARTAADLVASASVLSRPELLSGVERTYQPKEDGGEVLPPESKRIQVRATDVLADVRTAMTRLLDVTLTKDATNDTAHADIVVDGETLVADVPVTFLLGLEKRVAELLDFIKKLPVLDPADAWSYDTVSDAFATEPVRTVRPQKLPRNHVLAEATKEHPAQVQIYTEDVPIGYWTTVKYSGALPQARVRELRDRLVRLADAVKIAREQANTATVVDRAIGDKIFSYVFGS